MDTPAPRGTSLDGRRFDVVVIGGGISGVAIAKSCAQGGLRTLLLEQHDYGSGTSSRSTRIIHGGLRYLEHGEIGLVRESLRERERLHVEKPHLVRPLKFLLAFPQKGNALSLRNPIAVRFGLWLYKRMGGGCKHRVGDLQRSADLERWRVFDYEDAQCEFPERLIAEWLTEALAAGAVARNHSEVLEIVRTNGTVRGVRVRDNISGAEFRVQSGQVINATGPWADRVCQASNIRREPMLGGVRGSHILLPRFPGAPSAAVYTEAADGRPFFVLPWNGQTLVGTTEVPDHGDPARSRATDDEVRYLFRSFARIFPSSGLTPRDIHYSFAGIRPLPCSDEAEVAAISRKYFLRDHRDDGAAGLISVLGGKLTTAAALGRHCARMLGAHAPEPRPMIVAQGPANGYQATLAHWSKQVSDATRNCRGVVTMNSARSIAEWHGRQALSIVRRSCQHPLLTERLVDHGDHIVGEAVRAVEMEQAVTLSDILLRRVPVALHPEWNDRCSQQAGRKVAKALGWSAARLGDELEVFEQERSDFLQRPSPSGGWDHLPSPKQDVA